jgi:hypothetical protein
MPKIGDVCSHVRSKNAGPFWITVDLFFDDETTYRRYRDSPSLGGGLFERLYGARADLVKRVPMDGLRMIKISYPRPNPQGWRHERDMHGGQQFARLLNVEIEAAS